MFTLSTKAHSVRYTIDNRPQTAWSTKHLAAALSELRQHGRAVIAVAVAWQHEGVVTEEFLAEKNAAPLAGESVDQVYRLFQQEIPRNLAEDWAAFIQRSGSETAKAVSQLIEELANATDVITPPEHELLFRLSWCSEAEWQQYFGRNLLKLMEGSRTHPEVGQDIRGITYLFKYPDQQRWQGQTQHRQAYVIERHTTPAETTGRRLFDLAETVCGNMDQIQQDVSQFMIGEWRKKLPEETIVPSIVHVVLQLNTAEEMSVSVSLDDVHPDNEPLYQYWEVKLEGLKPVRLI